MDVGTGVLEWSICNQPESFSSFEETPPSPQKIQVTCQSLQQHDGST